MTGTSKRTYEETHPWLSFRADLQRAGFQFWMNLGAIQSKCEHVGRSLLPPPVARRLHNLFLAKGVAATTAIEGNTLSEQQVLDRIHRKSTLPPSKEYQGQEVDNVVEACNRILKKCLASDDCRLTTGEIKTYNGMVLKGLELEEGVVPAEISAHNVVVAEYRGAPREDCEHLLNRLCNWVNDEIAPPDKTMQIGFAVIRAVLSHLYLAWIHPFGDGNGRTARLIEFQILLSVGVPSIAAHLLSNHYNQTRSEYYRLLGLSNKHPEGVIKFLEYAVVGMRDGLDAQIGEIRSHLRAVAWRDFVYEQFRDKGTTAAQRQRRVALELGRKRRVSTAAISRLTPDLARDYATKTAKTVSRDINALKQMGLVVVQKGTVSANVGILEELLPKRRVASSPNSK